MNTTQTYSDAITREHLRWNLFWHCGLNVQGNH